MAVYLLKPRAPPVQTHKEVPAKPVSALCLQWEKGHEKSAPPARIANMCNLFPVQHSTSCDTVFAGGRTMTIEEAFSKALKEARKEMGITQQKAAELPDKE